MNDEPQASAELKEVKQMLADIRREFVREAAEDTWTRYASVTIVILAVLAAFASQMGGRYGGNVLQSLNDSTLSQSQATDQWSYFQAKSIKQHLFEIALEELPAEQAELRTHHEAKIAEYKTEKAAITAAARAHEEARDAHRIVADHWGVKARAVNLAVTIFSIAIAVGSLCLLVERQWLWYLCLMFGLLAMVQLLYGWQFLQVATGG